MRRILQSKTGVSCLTVVAFVCIAANFVRLPQRPSASVSARENTALVEELKEESYHVPPVCRVAAELNEWRELFPLETLRRDPFAAVFVAPPATVTNVPIMPTFQLQAVSLTAGRALAVINRKVVAEGETIEGCRVEKILRTEVLLVSPVFGPINATFDRTPLQLKAAANKSASANAPAADLPASPADASSPGGANGTANK
jgi:hypothetical protein